MQRLAIPLVALSPALVALSLAVATSTPLGAQPPAAVSQAPIVVLVEGTPVQFAAAFVEDGALWIPVADLPALNGFTAKAEGLCANDLCVPVPAAARATWFRRRAGVAVCNATAVAKHLDQILLGDNTGRVFAAGPPGLTTARRLPDGTAPDFTLPDRDGKPVSLASFRGKKVLLLTWASW